MDQGIKHQLPATLQALVEEIETAAHREIQVKHDPNLPTSANARVLYGNHGQEGATPDSLELVLMFGKDMAATDKCYRQPFAIVCHELRHLHRWIVEGVPSLHSIEGLPESSINPDEDPIKRLFTTSGIDEQVEHCAIDRSLPAYGFEGPYKASYQEVWDSFPSQPWQNWAGMRWVVLQEWIRVQLLTNNAHLQHHAKGVMRRFGMLDEAQQLTDIFKLFLASPDQVNAKYGMMLLIGATFRIPIERFWFLNRRPGCLELRLIPTAFQVRTAEGDKCFQYQLPKQVQIKFRGETICL